jgi:hypothetical protein
VIQFQHNFVHILNFRWQQWSLDVYEAMKNDFMRPAINVVREQISLMKCTPSVLIKKVVYDHV